MKQEQFSDMLRGGHPNSLGRTEDVVELILADPSRLEELYQCYSDPDEVVRLRTSSAFKRVAKAQPEWLEPYIDRFLTQVAALNQASAQWTLAQLCLIWQKLMTESQFAQAKAVLKHNLMTNNDWIVLNMTMETLSKWAEKDEALKAWLQPKLDELKSDPRKSVAKRATKYAAILSKE